MASNLLVWLWSYTPDEAAFWAAFRSECAKKQRDVLLCAPLSIPSNSELFPLPSALGEVGKEVLSALSGKAPSHYSPDDKHLDLILESARNWGEKLSSPEEMKVQAQALLRLAFELLEATSPELLLIWNGEHPFEIALRCAAAAHATEVVYLERGPFFGSLFVDSEGILGKSKFVADSKNSSQGTDAIGDCRFFEVLRQGYLQSRPTWIPGTGGGGFGHREPRLAAAGGSGCKAVFLVQLDKDVSCFGNSPHFRTNLEALDWSYSQLSAYGVDLVVKSHPLLKKVLPAQFAELTEYCRRNRLPLLLTTSLSECLDWADGVVTVNSTGLYEACFLHKPVLTLGRGLFSNAGIAYEVDDPQTGAMEVGRWQQKAQFDTKQRLFAEFVERLCLSSLYFFGRVASMHSEMPGPSELAERLIASPGGSREKRAMDDQWIAETRATMRHAARRIHSRPGPLTKVWRRIRR